MPANTACSARAALLRMAIVLFTHWPQAAIGLQVALDHVVVIEVFGIFVGTGEHVVVVRHRRSNRRR